MYSYYSPAPSTSTALEQPTGLTYNAQTSQWVPSGVNQQQPSSVAQYAQPPAAGDSHSYYSSNPNPITTTTSSAKRVPPSNPVATFTSYYHGWKAVESGQRPMPHGATKEWYVNSRRCLRESTLLRSLSDLPLYVYSFAQGFLLRR